MKRRERSPSLRDKASPAKRDRRTITPLGRKCFLVGKWDRPCTAAGCLFYTIAADGKAYFLLQYSHKSRFYEDFGGKVEHTDKSPLQTAIREAVEETNASIFNNTPTSKAFKKNMKREIHAQYVNFNKHKNRCFSTYYDVGKYKLHLIFLPLKITKKLVPKRFGTHEFHENTRRDIKALSKDVLLKHISDRKCNPRLCCIFNISAFRAMK